MTTSIRPGYRSNRTWRSISAAWAPATECLDHVITLGEVHLRGILQAYARYYNDLRTHRSLNKDAPFSRPVQRIGRIRSHAVLGGLHHQYMRV